MKILRKERKNLLTKVKSQVETDPFLKLSVASREGQGFRAKKHEQVYVGLCVNTNKLCMCRLTLKCRQMINDNMKLTKYDQVRQEKAERNKYSN